MIHAALEVTRTDLNDYDAVMIKTADRMSSIKPFHVMDILARAHQLEAQGRDIVHMEVGEPDFVTLPEITEAGRTALADGKTHYTAATGLPKRAPPCKRSRAWRRA